MRQLVRTTRTACFTILVLILSSRANRRKCVRLKDPDKCESCETLQIPCLFHDRERYFAERTRYNAERSRTATGDSTERCSSSASNYCCLSQTPETGPQDPYAFSPALFNSTAGLYQSPIQPPISVAAHRLHQYVESMPSQYGSGADMWSPSNVSDCRYAFSACSLCFQLD